MSKIEIDESELRYPLKDFVKNNMIDLLTAHPTKNVLEYRGYYKTGNKTYVYKLTRVDETTVKVNFVRIDNGDTSYRDPADSESGDDSIQSQTRVSNAPSAADQPSIQSLQNSMDKAMKLIEDMHVKVDKIAEWCERNDV